MFPKPSKIMNILSQISPKPFPDGSVLSPEVVNSTIEKYSGIQGYDFYRSLDALHKVALTMTQAQLLLWYAALERELPVMVTDTKAIVAQAGPDVRATALARAMMRNTIFRKDAPKI